MSISLSLSLFLSLSLSPLKMDIEEEDVTSTQASRQAKKAVDSMDQAVLKRKVILVLDKSISSRLCRCRCASGPITWFRFILA